VTKARTLKLLQDVDKANAGVRFCVAAFSALRLIEQVDKDGTPTTFVDPNTFSHLEVLKRGFFGRLKWLLLGK
jgi:hypothetical protein